MVSKKLTMGVPEIAPLSIARMITKHKLAVVSIWIMLSAITVGVVMKLPPVYKSEALILVDSQKIPEKYVSSTVNADLQDRLETIRQQILSATRLKTLIDDLKLYQDQRKNHVDEEIIEMMRGDIKISLEKGWSGNRPGAFRVSYQGPVPTVVAEVASRLTESFVNENLKEREDQATGTKKFISDQVEEARQNLEKLEAAISTFKTEHNGELPQQEISLNNALSRLQTELQGNQEAISRTQQTKVVLENTLSLAETAENAAAKELGDANNASGLASASAGAPVQNVRRRSEVLQDQLDAMRLRYSDDFPDVRRLKDEIARLKAQEAQQSAETVILPGTPASANRNTNSAAHNQGARELLRAKEHTSTIRAQLKTINEELEHRAAEGNRILADVKECEKRLNQIPVREQQMEGLTRDYENAKARYRTLLDKKDGAVMASAMELAEKGEKFTVIDRPLVPEKPFSPNRPLWASLGSGLGLLFGIAFAIGKELKSNCFLGEWELPENVVTIGRVPIIEFSADGEISGPQNKQRKRRMAFVVSALFSLLGVIAAGAYFAWKQF